MDCFRGDFRVARRLAHKRSDSRRRHLSTFRHDLWITFELSTAWRPTLLPLFRSRHVRAMTYPPDRPRLSLRSPADVLAAVPYLLGFHPSDSVVLLGLHDHRLVFHARGDLPPEGAARSEVSDLATYLADVLHAQGVTEALVVGYGAACRVTPLMLGVAQTMPRRGIAMVERLRATDGRYWSYDCEDPTCCPPEGVPFDVTGSVVAASATLAGFVAFPDREALVHTLDPPSGAELGSIEETTRRVAGRLDRQRRERRPRGSRPAPAAGRRAPSPDRAATPSGPPGSLHDGHLSLATAIRRYSDGGRLSDDEVAYLTLLLDADRGLRAMAWRQIERGEAPTTGPARIEPSARARPSFGPMGAHLALWTDVVRRCDPRLVAAPAVLLAYACWRSGDGVLASVAVDRALSTDPAYPPALLMDELLQRAVPPPEL